MYEKILKMYVGDKIILGEYEVKKDHTCWVFSSRYNLSKGCVVNNKVMKTCPDWVKENLIK